MTNRLSLRKVVAIAICLAGTIMFSGCEIHEKEEEEEVIPTSFFTQNGSGSQTGVVSGENIVASVQGTGTLTLSGTCNFAKITLSSAGHFSGSNLEIRTAEVTNTGSGSIYIWVTDRLDVRIQGSGSVFYKGNPIISSNVQGSGRLVKL
jgi:hypothetical protein